MPSFVSSDGGAAANITHDIATASGFVNTSPSVAEVTDSSGSSATANDTGSASSAGAYVEYSIDSRAIAVHPDSGANLGFAMDSSSLVNNGQQYTLDNQSDTHFVNGKP
jgi:hypothetical protein